ncbi:MAG: dipeptide/oligopeptide/nickel ABC transporter permease/ATP-binding protein [Solirubrobacteraceae bacterium]
MSVATPAVLSNEAEAVEAIASGHPKGVIRTVLASKRGICALAFLILVFLASELAGLITSGGPDKEILLAVNQGPSVHHLLGTDELGRDILTRVLYGGRSSLVGIAEAIGALLVIAIPLGVVSGYVGGLTDRVITRIADLVMSIPVIIILLAVLAIFGHSMTTAMIAFGVLGAAGVTRVIRSAALTVRSEAFIDAAKVIGVRRIDIIFRHVLPQCRGVIVVQAALFAAIALGVQTGLTYLSLGPAPPAPTWGGMVADAVSQFYVAPWQLVPSGAVIALTVIALGVLGDVVRDAIADSHSASAGGVARRRRTRSRARDLHASPDALLEAVGLTVAVGGRGAETSLIKDVSLAVAPGEALGIVGESGSGKSITIKALAGLLPNAVAIIEGSVHFGGAELTTGRGASYRAIRGHGIAIVTQEPMRALDPSYRVGKLLSDVVRAVDHCGRAEARSSAIELLRRVQILEPDDVAQRYPHEISGGMAQRVAIAMALAGHPKLLLADEPTTALDVTVQAEILDLLRRLQQETGMALILVSHDLGVVAEVCARVCVMYAGEIVEVAPSTDLFVQPMHPYTRALMNSSPRAREDRGQLTSIPGTVPGPRDWPIGCHFAGRCEFSTEACVAGPVELRPVTRTDRARCVRSEELFASPQSAPTEVTR